MFNFGKKNALIMGGGQNIGRAIALEFAGRGSNVAVADLNAAGARETAELVATKGVKSLGVACDVTSEQSIATVVAAVEADMGPIDILINNAGVIHSGNPEDFPASEWERVFGVNFFGAVRANAIVMPGMLDRGEGYIVNTASFAGLYPYATNRIPYAASKAALISMSENMAISLRPRGVRVSCLCPGPTMTTSIHGMQPWSENVVMRGPGSNLPVASQAHAATALADGMSEERVVILTHEGGWELIRARGESPDRFIRQKIEEFERGESGLPTR